MSKENYLELIGQLIDIFEDFLDDKGIIIENHERDEDVNLIPEESANIYGEDYYTLEDKITDTLQKWNIIDSKDNVEDLNTMDTFGNGFRVERDGKVFTLTSEEMSDFRYLDTALVGRGCLECYSDYADKYEKSIISEMMKDKEICYNIEEDILDISFMDIGDLEQEVIQDYIKRNKDKK